ncbi:hypothetical protein QWZ08_16040 [Ferruginibacter paludis]|uniref:hypothetical protein n=1 Tax=Ferruginibacter paludis TaxID=1310417 RepID=UPI0025B5D09D|nr:hypothetical protein [Ferruginibacter paludis]MDN3657160.1 hypothetical protein [Ferruginibacter paludis]
MRRIFMISAALKAFVLTSILFQMTSCKKTTVQAGDNCPPAAYPVTGLWEGTYQTDQVNHIATYCSFTIYPDGTFMKRAQVISSTEYELTRGTWKLNGTLFEYQDTSILPYSGGSIINKAKLTFSDTGTLTDGTWQDLSGQTYTGTFQNMRRNK